MTTSAWIKVVAKSFVAAAVFAAAQLGVGQALGILRWDAAGDAATRSRLLAWLVFIFAAAVLAGVTVCGRGIRGIRAAIANKRALVAAARNAGTGRTTRRTLRTAPRRMAESARAKVADAARIAAVPTARFSATIAAAAGAALAFPLVWVPTRSGPAAQALPPLTLAVIAGAGIAIGVVLALVASTAAPVAVGGCATVAWVWTFALVSVGLQLSAGGPAGTHRLGILDAPGVLDTRDWWLGPYLMIGIAAVFGLAIAAASRWLGATRFGIALSGFAGPALIAAAYLVAGPGSGTAGGGPSAPYVASLLAATVGLLVSTAVAAGYHDVAVPATRSRTPVNAVVLRPAIEPPRPSARAAIAAAFTPTLAIEAGPAHVLEPAPAQAKIAPARPAPVIPAAEEPAPVPAKPVAAKAAPARPAPAKPALAKAAKPARPVPAAADVPAQRTPDPSSSPPRPPTRERVIPPQPKGRAARRRLARETSRKLHKREREHIDWVQNLVNIPTDPELNARRK